MSHGLNANSNVAGLPEVVARPVPTEDPYSVEEAAVLHQTVNSSGDYKTGDNKKSSQFDTPYHSYHQGAPSTQASSAEYWGRFNDPEVTVLPTAASGGAEDDIPVATARLDDRKIRHAFLRKVYLILSAQMMFTFGVCALIALNDSVKSFALSSNGVTFYYFNVVNMLIMICALRANKRSYPTNMILLGVFTLSASYMIGMITAMYADSGAGDVVMEAVFITTTVFIVLTLYTLQSKWDFSFLGAGLGLSLWILILWGFFGMIFGLQTGSVYALLGSVVFSLFIIYDTYMIAERMDPEDYVIAAIELYLDLINLFLYILQLLSRRR